MFTDAPPNVRDLIYDYCTIETRMNLNMALPTQYRQCRAADRKLVLFKKIMKRYHLQNKLSSNVERFINENHCDPTVVEMCKENAISIAQPKLNMCHIEAFMSAVRAQVFDETYQFPIPTATEFRNNDAFPGAGIFSQCTPKVFGSLWANNNSRLLLQELGIIDTIVPKTFIFNMVNYGNEDLLKYVIEQKHVFSVDMDAALQYMEKYGFITRQSCRNIIFKYFIIYEDSKQAWLESAVESLDVETYIAVWKHQARPRI